MSVGNREASLTRQFRLASYRQAAAQLTAGMSVAEVQHVMRDAGADPAESTTTDMFVFDAAHKLVEDELVKTCKTADPSVADQLIWVCRLWIDHRLARVVERALTTADGKLDPSKINRSVVEAELRSYHAGDALTKASSNVLGYLVAAHIIDPLKHGSSIVGIAAELPTSAVVPYVVRFVAERLRSLAIEPAPGADPIDLAVGIGVNHWLNLTAAEFRRAATPPAASAAPPARAALPGELATLDAELRRRGQVVLQGPPGVGKTYQAMRYLDWSASGRRHEAQATRLLLDLPSHERTPGRLAQRVVELGLTAVWDIVQFHPSYGYEDFVRTLVPVPVENGVTFRAEHRRLSFLASVGEHLARLGSAADLVLVVDEINRADISRVFGELLYALEYRDEAVATPYVVDGSNAMVLPANLFLIGTMNTADRSLALIDYALRRRFTFLELAPERSVVANAAWHGADDRAAALRLFDHVSGLFIGNGAEVESLAVGHSYFLPSSKTQTAAEAMQLLARRYAYEIGPLLNEYAAEGLVDLASLDARTSQLGIPAGTRDQRLVESHVLQWLTGQP